MNGETFDPEVCIISETSGAFGTNGGENEEKDGCMGIHVENEKEKEIETE